MFVITGFLEVGLQLLIYLNFIWTLQAKCSVIAVEQAHSPANCVFSFQYFMPVCAEIWLATPQYWEIYIFLVLMIINVN